MTAPPAASSPPESPAPGGGATPPRPVILDCDPGIDDAFAIVFGCGHHGIALRGLTTVAGNVGLDLATAAGHLWDAFTHTFPVVLGRDFAGTVDAVGAGVDGLAPGDAVAGVITGADLRTGTMAESLVAGYLAGGLRELVTFGVLLALLSLFPRGLVRARTREV